MSTEARHAPAQGHVMRTARRAAVNLVLYAILIAGAVVMMMPLVYMVGTAFMANQYTLSTPPIFIPPNPTFQNFVDAWNNTAFPFGRYFLNSVIVSVSATAISVLFSAMLAFAFARYRFPGRNLMFYGMLATFMVPTLVLIIPQYALAKQLNLLNSLQGLVIVYSAGIALNVFLLKGFFEDIPKDLADAAAIDGASIWRLFWSIMVPLAKPALATVTIFSFLGSWQEFTVAYTFISNSSLFTLPVGIQQFTGEFSTDYSMLFAASLIATMPMILVFLFFQRYFIKGIATGAIKG